MDYQEVALSRASTWRCRPIKVMAVEDVLIHKLIASRDKDDWTCGPSYAPSLGSTANTCASGCVSGTWKYAASACTEKHEGVAKALKRM